MTSIKIVINYGLTKAYWAKSATKDINYIEIITIINIPDSESGVCLKYFKASIPT